MLFPLTVSAAIFDTYFDDISGYQAAAGSLSRLYFEDFSSINVNTLITGPTNWNGFTIDLYNGGNCDYGCSTYSTNLGADIWWNSSAPNVKGVYADVGPGTGLSFTPLENTIAGMSFSFVDWNDFYQRSTFLITASDNTSTVLAGPTNGSDAPPQNFGVKLSASDIAAGRFITGIKWYGLASASEVVGFWNFNLFTNTNLDTCEASDSSCDSMISLFSLLGLAPPGPSSVDTQSSMQYQVSQLRSAFNTQTVAANFALNYDCNVFDVKGMCISAGGRYTTIDSPGINNSAATVTLGYKVNSNIRIGAYLDQNINISNPAGINISNNTPLMGAYAVWNKEQSGLGYQVRVANTYQDKDVTSTRTVFDTSEAGSGKTSLTSQSYLAELSYAFQYQDKTLVRPYAGLRYTHLKQDGYTEGSVDNPLTIASLRDKSATALLGVKINRNLTDKATLTAQLGLEQDLHHKVGNYSATNSNIGDLDSVAFNSNIKRTRPVASIGAFYDVTKTQRASATINYQQLPFQSTGSATAYLNYMIGF